VELRLTKRYVETMGFSLPDKGVRKPALIVWLEAFADRLHEYTGVHSEDLKPRERERYLRDAEDCRRVAEELRVLVKGDDGEEVPDDYEKGIMGRWVRDYSDKDALALKPIMVDKYAQRYLWQHGHKHLLMSASIISADEMAFSLGLEEGSYTTVTVPSTFPVENRPIIYAPVMPVTHVNKQAWTAKLGPAVMNILYAHPDDRVLIHCVNYQLAKDLHAHVADIYYHMGVMRPLHTYTGRNGKEQALQDYLRQPSSVMFAPSMDRGVDLPDDLCRVQIVCKVPYVSLGDAQVSQRLHSPGGQLWYTVQNVRTIVQMVGRGVRHKDDSCTTYVLDKEFGKMMKKHSMLLPGWFAEAVDMGADVRWVLKQP
jgi:Rad3-related DNA helicase